MAELRNNFLADKSQDEINQTNNVITPIDKTRAISIIGQIHNWQHCGIAVTFVLPMTNINNSSIFALENRPFAVPLKYLYQSKHFVDTEIVAFWQNNRMWHVPISIDSPDMFIQDNIGKGISVKEFGTMPFLSLMLLHHYMYRGAISFKIVQINNFTTQGKIAVSVRPNVARPRLKGNWFSQRTPYDIEPYSSRINRDTDHTILDIGRDSQTDILVPFRDNYEWKSIYQNSIIDSSQGENPVAQGNVMFFEPMGTLDISAGSKEVTFEIYFKAEEDFELSFPIPMSASMRNGMDEDISDPYIFGEGAVYRTDGVDEITPLG